MVGLSTKVGLDVFSKYLNHNKLDEHQYKGYSKAMNIDELSMVGQKLFNKRWQAPLARRLGIAPETVSRWMSGKQKISPAMVKSINYLLDTNISQSHIEQRISKAASRLTPVTNSTLLCAEPTAVSLEQPIDVIITAPFDNKSMPVTKLLDEPEYYLRKVFANLSNQLAEDGLIIFLCSLQFDCRWLTAIPREHKFIQCIPISVDENIDSRLSTAYLFGQRPESKLPSLIKVLNQNTSELEGIFQVERTVVDQLTHRENLLCDPFMGDGRIAYASATLKRQFIGIEPDRKAVRWVSAMLKAHFSST